MLVYILKLWVIFTLVLARTFFHLASYAVQAWWYCIKAVISNVHVVLFGIPALSALRGCDNHQCRIEPTEVLCNVKLCSHAEANPCSNFQSLQASVANSIPDGLSIIRQTLQALYPYDDPEELDTAAQSILDLVPIICDPATDIEKCLPDFDVLAKRPSAEEKAAQQRLKMTEAWLDINDTCSTEIACGFFKVIDGVPCRPNLLPGNFVDCNLMHRRRALKIS